MSKNLDEEIRNLPPVLFKGYDKEIRQIPITLDTRNAIKRLIVQEKIKEVERLSRYVELRNSADGATISAHYLYRQARKRIAELEKELEQ